MHIKSGDTAPIEHAPGLFAKKLIDGARGAHRVSLIQGWLKPGAKHSLHTHDVEEAVLFTSGQGVLWLDGKQYEVGPGDAVHIPPVTPHSTENTHERDDLHFVAAFSESMISSHPLEPLARAGRRPFLGRSRLWNRLRWVGGKLAHLIR